MRATKRHRFGQTDEAPTYPSGARRPRQHSALVSSFLTLGEIITYYQPVAPSSRCHIAALEEALVVKLLMPLSAFIADSIFPRDPRRSEGCDREAMALASPRLHGPAPRACMMPREPFDLAFAVAPQRPAMRACSTLRMEARRG
jgi:hypothetical protein